MANNVLIEGLDNNQRTGLLTVLIPPAEAIDAVSVTTSNYDAEFGRAAGAVTSVTLKSGTNQLRGSAFWFGNTDATNALPASTYFSKTRTKPPTTYNQFGFTIGGPIQKNKFFFFGDYQRTQDRLGSSYLFVVPTEAFRRGDFSAAPTKVYDPATGDAAGNGRVQFANNQIPANRISPIAQALMAKIPLPNRTDVALGVGNYQVDSYRDKNTDSFDVKFNYAVNAREPDLGAVQLPAPRSHAVAGRRLRRLGRPARRRLHGHRHEHDVQHGRQLDAHLLEHLPHGSPRRHELLPQRGADDRQRPEPRRAGGDQGRQPRRVDERAHDHQHRERLRQLRPGVRRQPALGSLGAHLGVLLDR